MNTIRDLPSALTFDDGPHRSITPRLLDLLDEAQIKASFFLIGKLAATSPDIVSRIAERGHEIGNHSWSHLNFKSLSDEQFYEELTRTHDCLFRLSGTSPRLLRPPYGEITLNQRNLANEWFGYSTVLWNIDTRDWRRAGTDLIAKSILSSKGKGSVILLHDTNLDTLSGVALALAEMPTASRDFVTVTSLRKLVGERTR